jgi:hypothetical protein
MMARIKNNVHIPESVFFVRNLLLRRVSRSKLINSRSQLMFKAFRMLSAEGSYQSLVSTRKVSYYGKTYLTGPTSAVTKLGWPVFDELWARNGR